MLASPIDRESPSRRTLGPASERGETPTNVSLSCDWHQMRHHERTTRPLLISPPAEHRVSKADQLLGSPVAQVLNVIADLSGKSDNYKVLFWCWVCCQLGRSYRDSTSYEGHKKHMPVLSSRRFHQCSDAVEPSRSTMQRTPNYGPRHILKSPTCKRLKSG